MAPLSYFAHDRTPSSSKNKRNLLITAEARAKAAEDLSSKQYERRELLVLENQRLRKGTLQASGGEDDSSSDSARRRPLPASLAASATSAISVLTWVLHTAATTIDSIMLFNQTYDGGEMLLSSLEGITIEGVDRRYITPSPYYNIQR
ncbi:hypothetical protein MMC22_008428 [Lobaria immixta]|nr:hypothetical protein [Lobaria immixta]